MSISKRVLTILIAVVLVLAAQGVMAAPQIEFVDGPTFDFGEVQPNATLTHEFVFKNIGDELLQIHRVKGG